MPQASTYPLDTFDVTDFVLGTNAAGAVKRFAGSGFGGGNAAGSSLQLQYNNASAFGGMSGTSWDDANRSLTMTGATVTTSNPVLDMTQTWNAGAVAFTGLKLNITATAASTASKFLDIQLAGTSLFYLQPILSGTVDNQIFLGGQTGSPQAILLTDSNAINLTVAPPHTNGNLLLRGGAVPWAGCHTSNGFVVDPNKGVNWALGGVASTPEVNITEVAAKVLQVGDGAKNANGWMQWAGLTRVAADVPFTSTTTLGTVTGLSVNVQAGRTYKFEANLSFTDAAAGGAKAAIAGTCTATAIQYDGWMVADNAIKGLTQATALGTTVASSVTTATSGFITIQGTITVNAAGTLLCQGSQNTSSGTATTFKRGSTFVVFDMP